MNYIVVKLREYSRFDLLHHAFGQQVDVIWDRRRSERRRVNALLDAEDRRRRDRRGSPPPSWTALDFVVVSGQR